MALRELDHPGSSLPVEQVLGYINFSAGAADPLFLAGLNAIYGWLDQHPDVAKPTYIRLRDFLLGEIEQRSESSTFRDADQARAVIPLVFDIVIPGYLSYHQDLLFHHTPETICRPFFIGRVFEAVIRQGAPWTEKERVLQGAIQSLSDYIGHRPVAALESQKIEPYRHEFVRPLPIFVRGAGVGYGSEQTVVELALKLLEETDPDLLQAAQFNPKNLMELAIDPRAYDFDHPANKRPNYHFGQWDPHQIDQRGHYRRFVVQQVTLDALMRRLEETDIPRDELLFEAAAVLAGTILMASGVSGEGPGTYDSSISLARLLPQIARYRDEFYNRLFKKASGPHSERLRAEAEEKRQPFGGARQHLNAQLARKRASQLEHVHLARIFARMGNVSAAAEQANIVPCASARMICQIDCLLTTGQLACDRAKLDEAAAILPQVMDLIRRGIQCGAVIDPWNILGFDANFSLFPAMENSVRDHRADELVALMDRLFALYSRVWSEAAATDNADLSRRVSRQFKETANWWHRFAAHEVSTVEAVDPLAVYRAAEGVAQALNVWHKGGAAAGDVAFWSPHAEMFDSPKAYTLVIEALLERRDMVASMALLIHWLGQAEKIGFERANCSFHDLANRWFSQTLAGDFGTVDDQGSKQRKAWDLARKFLDFLEANAESFWEVPRFQVGKSATGGTPTLEEESGDDEFSSAYEDMVYKDSTDDGISGSIFESSDNSHDMLLSESKRVADRLAFLATVARLWKMAAVNRTLDSIRQEVVPSAQSGRLAVFSRWIEQAQHNQERLLALLADVKRFAIPLPSGDHDSMIEYDRRRMTKESLLERIVSTTVETADASRLLSAARIAVCPGDSTLQSPELDEEARCTVRLFSALLSRDDAGVRPAWEDLWSSLAKRPLLYVPLSKGGDPAEIVRVRSRQRAIQDLLAWFPRQGLWVETCELLEVARQMERDHPVGPGAVTEFDELFKIGYRALVESLVSSSQAWPRPKSASAEKLPEPLVACLEQLTESLLTSWLAHSRTLRLSVLERVHDKNQWKRLVTFIEEFGAEVFTQRFLNLANIRAILHQGTLDWLTSQQKDPSDEAPEKLLEALQGDLKVTEAAELLGLALEAVVENYGEYRDYNSTTTQSDRGELLYMLLDFLRLRTRYDRVCWNLKPVVLAHEILVRHELEEAARIWRKALTDRIHDEANEYLRRLAELQKKYAMRMPTVADRLAERFIRPLSIDRIRALVRPSIDEIRDTGTSPKFQLLVEETDQLTHEPTGVGLDVPAWIVGLEEEVEHALRPEHEQRRDEQLASVIPAVLLTQKQARKQIDTWANRKS